ncbi:efflux RND transporter periplasmic adaptor subunit [Actibacterium lipolyticum]|uniref:Efflux pump periplasmic linker BepF n=1 Tax=Actibacterium lipolyticum TaxID=1524263 RepID=A0A238KRY9_9RHOB|nr:efflux RND transporter periplasmic adaptor subunit [Actibacterium lipolyticum]SMX44892.1 Efflux pump periplasmic linker BepF [Actibacterium lipolyticum]
MRTVLALLTLLATPVFAEESATPVETAPRPVVSEQVNTQTGERTTYVGSVAARVETDLAFPLIGTIAERGAELGDIVKAGDLLAQLSPEDLDSDVRAAEAGVTVATAQLRSAKDADERARALEQRGVGSAVQTEDTERALAAATARLEQANSTLARAQEMRSFADLTAPQDGIITQVYAEAGVTLAAGEPVLSLAATDGREIVIDLTEQDSAAMDIGATFDVWLVARSDIRSQATLTRIDPVAERSTRTRRLHLTLEEPADGFLLGSLAWAAPVDGAEAGISIPLAAVVDPQGAPHVWVVDRSTNTVARTKVVLGEQFGARVRVTDGLTAGDEVITRGINSIEDGQRVGPRVSQ